MVGKSDKEEPRIGKKCEKFVEGNWRGQLVKECKVGGAGVKLRFSGGAQGRGLLQTNFR